MALCALAAALVAALLRLHWQTLRGMIFGFRAQRAATRAVVEGHLTPVEGSLALYLVCDQYDACGAIIDLDSAQGWVAASEVFLEALADLRPGRDLVILNGVAEYVEQTGRLMPPHKLRGLLN